MSTCPVVEVVAPPRRVVVIVVRIARAAARAIVLVIVPIPPPSGPVVRVVVFVSNDSPFIHLARRFGKGDDERQPPASDYPDDVRQPHPPILTVHERVLVALGNRVEIQN